MGSSPIFISHRIKFLFNQITKPVRLNLLNWFNQFFNREILKMDTVQTSSLEGVDETDSVDEDSSCDHGFKLPKRPIIYRIDGIFPTQVEKL